MKKQYILIRNLAYAIVLITIFSMSTIGCSTQKNTAQSRWWHAFNAKYNTYYNGTLAYIDASLEKEAGNKDNYTEQIPLYTVTNKTSKELGKANYDRAIEKCEKAIHQHSIKSRPEWTKSRKKTEKDIEWLSRREYNPFLWKAWMLMGRSQFFKGDFNSAATTFAYMSRLYATQPAIYGKARAWLAKCYIEQDWMYDAEDVIRNMMRDSIHWSARKEWDYTLADYHIRKGEAAQAIPYLKKVIKHEMRRKQKAREWYLMGQLQASIGNRQEAYKAFRHVVRLNPPYELDFNARISMTEVMAASNSKKMIGKLKRMAASDNNQEYLDQIYYAIGNIYLAQKDTLQAIGAYEKGVAKATRSGIEKGVLLLHLGDIYWIREKFSDAQRCYGEAIGLLDKERDDYEQLSNRSKVLDELVPHTDAVALQDSLQTLAKMDEKDRNAAIDRVITALKKKEKEEKNKQAEEDAARNQQGGNGGNFAYNNKKQNNTNANNAMNGMNGMNKGQWYFYSPMAVSQGKAQFQKLWGKRENVDNWQRINKTVVASAQGAEEMTDEMRDSLANVAAQEDSLKQITDSAVNDPHKREYYLAQIPFTPEQLAESNKLLEDGLYHSGVIFKDKLDNFTLSEKALRRLVDHYPDYEHLEDAYYHLYLLYSRMKKPDVANAYVEKLKKDYPESQWTTLLSDPYYMENAKMGVHLEDSLYTLTYQAFKDAKYEVVKENAAVSEKRFPTGENRDKFLFISGMTQLNEGNVDSCMTLMKTVVEKYPNSRLSEMAGMIVNGVNAGKRLYGGKFDLSNVWSMRSEVISDNDSTQQRSYSAERNDKFVFLLAYVPDSVNENQLLFEMAKYNFTSYMARNFDLNIEDIQGLHRLQVSGFQNYDEARQYANEVFKQSGITRLISKARAFVISEPNLALLGTKLSYDDYDKFYSKHFAPLKISQLRLLIEPAEICVGREQEEETSGRDSETGDHQLDELEPKEDLILGPVNQNTEQQNTQEEEFTLPANKKEEEKNQEEEFTLPENKKEEEKNQEEEFTLPANKEENKKQEDDNTFEIQPQQKEEKTEDTGIDFEEKQPEDSGLEDEYFELDGF